MERRIEPLNPSRILAIDFGEKRIGIALTDPLQLFAKPLCCLENKGFRQVLSEIRNLISIHEVGMLIIGLPLSIEGKRTAKTIETEEFINKVRNKLSIPVLSWDERYSTSEANDYLKEMGYGWKEARQLIDAMAACMILKSYLESR
ncbi:MAG: Holliday junction resolvase RuvX [Candidatus Cloacimonetes bacterium]|nr:Holliday junction resolvase RuvX [Candidatus Cloacimonadota bacterium]